jgi:hypothetical protein
MLTVTTDLPGEVVQLLASMFAREQKGSQLMSEHQPLKGPGDVPRCSGCMISVASGTRAIWPCTTYAAAREARRLEVLWYGE